MTYLYAQIRDGKVVAKTRSDRPIEGDDMVEIESFDDCAIGDSYADGVFTPAQPE